MAKLSNLIEKYNRNHELARVKYAVFTLPIIGGHLFLAQRNTPPQVGLYSAVGGKVDPATEEEPDIQLPISPESGYVRDRGYERLKWTSLRELIEELYAGDEKLTPEDIRTLDLTGFRVYDYETLHDSNTGVECYFKIVCVPSKFSLRNRVIESQTFNPSKRETGRISKISDLHPATINPLTKVALYLMRFNFNRTALGVQEQIPKIPMEHQEGIIGLVGDGFRYHADDISGNGFYFDYDTPKPL